MRSKISEFSQGHGKISHEYYGDGEITYENKQAFSCNFVAYQLSNGSTYFAIDGLIPGGSFPTDLDKKFYFVGKTDSGLTVTIQPKDTEFFVHMSIGSSIIVIYLIRRFKVGTDNQKPVKKIHFGLTNFLFTGNKDGRSILELELWNLPSISIHQLPRYNEIVKILNDKKSVEVTSELIISVNDLEKKENIINLSYEICALLSICRGSKIFWIYYTCFDEQGGMIARYHCSMNTQPLSDSPELITSEVFGVEPTLAFLKNAHKTLLENPLLMKKLQMFSNVFNEARDGKGYIQSRGVKIVVLMEMLNKYVLEDPRFKIEEFILDPSFYKGTIQEMRKKCQDAIATEIGNVDDIRFSNRWNLPAIETINKVIDYRSDLFTNLSSLNRTPFRKMILRLCEKINLKVEEKEISWLVRSRNTLIHTGKFSLESKGDNPVWKEYLFLVNFMDKIFLKLFNYSGIYNNFKKWGSSLEDTI